MERGGSCDQDAELEVSKPAFKTRLLLRGGMSSHHLLQQNDGHMKGVPTGIPWATVMSLANPLNPEVSPT